MYHILPVAGNGRWQRNVEQLLYWLPLFNGRKTVAVMTDSAVRYQPKPGQVNPDQARLAMRLDSPAEVEAAFAGRGVECIRITNDPNLREVASHGPLFSRLADSYAPGDVALWAHAKGTTRFRGHVSERWADVLYEAMLAHWPFVLRVLAHKPVVGCFKKRGPGWHPNDSNSDWHYSGSWFWFRCHDLFARDWRRIDQFWSGIEPYPSQHFSYTEAGVVFYEGSVQAVNLYHQRIWDRKIHPNWVRWRRKHANERREPSAYE